MTYFSILHFFVFIATSKCCFFQGFGSSCYSNPCQTSSYHVNFVPFQPQDYNCNFLTTESSSTQSPSEYPHPTYSLHPRKEEYISFPSKPTANKAYPVPQARIY
uniref:Ovule protein n=1 Tax=Strongyloides venezuelensis TaxID=75913 RepID=A0A0K0FL21_STRVS